MRRRKQQSVSAEEQERAVLASLCQLLRKNGDRILRGEGKLSLTTESLGLLGGSIRRFSDAQGMGLAAAATNFNRTNSKADSRIADVEFLRDFISKTVAIKIMHGSNTMQGAIQINRFRSLKVLEVKKVPIHMIEGLQVLRGQLHTIIVSRSLQHMQDVFETCGGDMSAPMSWPRLKTASLSYNSIRCLDGSLRLLPFLEVFDASHNLLDKTDKNLEYLTELERLNLGYNCLDSLPTFSISCKAKMKTLVIKNNNLDNIEGVGELTVLQELDISDNCIADHKCLQPLQHLMGLQRLNTQGNPLFYHKDHRCLIVGCLAWQVITTQFELDGKKLSTSEIAMARHSKRTAASTRRPSAVAHSVITHPEHQDQTDSSGNRSTEYSFSESNLIATSLPVGSSRKKGKRRHKRTTREIADMDSSATEASSPEGSVASSPVKESTLADHVRTRLEVEMLRNHFGPNWLQAMDNHFSSDTTRSDASNSAASDTDAPAAISAAAAPDPAAPDPPALTNGLSESVPTEDDLYLNEPVKTVDVYAQPAELKPEDLNFAGFDWTRTEPVKEKSVDLNFPGFDWTRAETAKVKPVDLDFPGFEWARTEDEEIESYGEESEPFIVLFKQRNCEQLLVTLNRRYILEKNLNGAVVERLDLKSLLSVEQSEEKVEHEDVVGEVMMPHLKLSFNYIRKDRRERIYIMENTESAQKMCDLLQPFLDEKELQSQPKFIYHCLKCSHKFSKQEGKPLSNLPPMPTAGTSKDLPSLTSQVSVMYQCPKCSSDHVILVEKAPDSRSSSTVSTPVGSYTGSSSGSFLSPARNQRADSQDFVQSPLARSTPQKPQPISVRESPQRENVRRNLYSSSADTKLKADGSLRPRSNAFLGKTEIPDVNDDSAESYTGSVTTPIENKAFRRESWPNLGQVSHTRIASQDSDITILTNPSEGSIAVISESSSETLSALTPLENHQSIREIFDSDVKNTAFRDDSIVRSASEPKRLNIDLDQSEVGVEKRETTPMGSPLSNSICNSLVSSVYQNSGVTDQKDGSNSALESNILDIPQKSDMTSHSIYDSGIASSLPKDKRNGFHEESGSMSDCDAINVIPLKEDDKSVVDEEIVTRERSAAMYEHPFTHINHQLKLHLMMTLFDDSEEFECILKCDACQYLLEEEFKAILVMTATKFYVFKVAQDDTSENVSDWLTTIDIQPITELVHVDTGLGCQSFRLEFDTECSCYTFIVRDAEKCTNFVDFLSELLEKNVLCTNKKVQAEFHHSPSEETLRDMQRDVLSRRSEKDQRLELYLMGYLVRGQNPRYPVSFVLTNRAICLVKECHQWPQPRLQAPLDINSTAKHFTVLERQPINNIATVEVFEMDKTKMKLSFFNEQTGLETKWQITMETTNGIQSLVDGIRHPWEEEFGVEMDVAMVPFSDSENED